MYGLAVLSIALFAGQGAYLFVLIIDVVTENKFAAAATAIPDASPLAALIRRQTGFDPSEIPAQCQNDCSSVLNSLNVSLPINSLRTPKQS